MRGIYLCPVIVHSVVRLPQSLAVQSFEFAHCARSRGLIHMYGNAVTSLNLVFKLEGLFKVVESIDENEGWRVGGKFAQHVYAGKAC